MKEDIVVTYFNDVIVGKKLPFDVIYDYNSGSGTSADIYRKIPPV